MTKSDFAPPSYDPISTFPSSLGVSRIKRWMLIRKQKHATVLSRIRDLVTTKHFTPSSVAPIVNSCSAALSAAEFSELLQSLNIEGHTALYWAIVNCRLEALWAFIGFISKMSSICTSDLRLACMVTSNNRLFVQLNLGRTFGSDDESLRRSLGCQPDEVEVHEGGGLAQDKFVASFRFRMCQKRLRIIQSVGTEYVAAGRIWWFRIYMGREGKWCIKRGLSRHSLPAVTEAVFLVEAHGDKPDSVTGRARAIRLEDKLATLLAPEKNSITAKVK